MKTASGLAAALCTGISLAGCALKAPSHDVPTDWRGVSLTRSITGRIQCEIADMVRADREQIYEHQRKLLQEDYYVSMLLILGVTDKAGTTPNLQFPISPTLTFGITTNLDQSREDGQSIPLNYSIRDIYRKVSKYPEQYECPAIDTNLAGDLGLRRRFSAALEADGRPVVTKATPGEGEFSGTINFITTKEVKSAGPTWTFANFVGPKELLSASRIDNNKLQYGVAAGPNAGKPLDAPLVALNSSARAQFLLDRQIQIDLGNSLSNIRNFLR